MKIVIDISDKLIKKVKDHYVNPYEVDEICEAILNGTPLPKHHGDLIDRDELLIKSEWYGERATYSNPIPNGETAVPEEVVLNAPTIIEGSDANEDSN